MVAEITGAKILVAAADLLVIKLMITKSGISLQTCDQGTIGSLVCGPDALRARLWTTTAEKYLRHLPPPFTPPPLPSVSKQSLSRSAHHQYVVGEIDISQR